MREGDDIYTTVDLTFTQAALGATLVVPTLDGEEDLELPPGTQPGEIVVLRGRGMPLLRYATGFRAEWSDEKCACILSTNRSFCEPLTCSTARRILACST